MSVDKDILKNKRLKDMLWNTCWLDKQVTCTRHTDR